MQRTALKKRWNPARSTLVAAAARQRARSTAYHTNRRAAAMAASLYRAPSTVEVKSFDVTVGNNSVLVNAGSVAGAEPAAAFTGLTEVNCVPQGATVANRIGNKITIRSIHGRFSIVQPTTTGFVHVRWLLVYDKQPNGAFPTMTDMLLDQPAGTGNALSSINIANKSRFLFLRDQFQNFDSAQQLTNVYNFHVKGRWETEYGSNTSTIGDIKTGAIYFIVILVNAFSAAATFMPAAQFRIRYYD